MTKRRIPAAAAAAALASTALIAASALPAQAAPNDVVRFNFDGISLGSHPTTIPNQGTGPAANVVSENGGQVTVVNSRSGQGRAIDFPDHAAPITGPRAVIAVPGTTLPQVGTNRLVWRADFRLDTGTTATSGSADDGDNLLQRGLAGTAAQYKLQVDGERPSCTLWTAASGETVTARLTSAQKVHRGQWYTATCTRSGKKLTLTVVGHTGPHAGTTLTATNTSSTVLDLQHPATVPITVGGKMYHNTHIPRSSTDQFNGLVDNVKVSIGE